MDLWLGLLHDAAMDLPRLISALALDSNVALATRPVDARLAGHVRTYWTLVVESPPGRIRVIPDGQVDLVFDLDSGDAHIAGIFQRPFDAVHDRPTRLLGATFFPGGAAAFLGVSLSALEPAWQPLASVIGPVARPLIAHVLAAPDLGAQVNVIETFLLARLRRTDARVGRALGAIGSSRGRDSIGSLGRNSGASSRHLSRLFHEWVGLSPKRLARMLRAQGALRRLGEDPPCELAAIALEHGFADQAHLARELRALAGDSPRTLAELFKKKSDSFKP